MKDREPLILEPPVHSVSVLILARQAEREAIARLLSEDDPSAVVVREAASSEEALSLCRQSMPHCILLLPAPEMDHRAFIERLRAETAGAPPAVIVTSAGERTAEDSAAEHAVGADDHILLSGLPGKELRRRIRHTIERVRQRAELQHLQFALSETQQELERFGRIVSHDLRAPLFSVSSLCQLLQEHFGDDLEDEPEEFITLMMRSVQQMRQLIGDVLAYFRIPLPQKESLELEAVLSHALEEVKPVLQERGGQVEVVGPPATVYADRQQLVRLFQGLVSFAMQPEVAQPLPVEAAQRQPAVAQAAPPSIRIGAHRLVGGWQINVLLDSPAVTREDLERVLEFTSSRLRNYDGNATGSLGLAVARKIVRLHNGSFWIECGPEAGAFICFVIPDAAEPV